MRRRPARGSGDSVSIVQSVAHTVTSTIVDGLVHTIAHWRVILLGQTVSLILAVAGATNEILSMECKVSAPSTYNAFGYCTIAVLGAFALKREERLLKKGSEAISEEQERFQNSTQNDDQRAHDEDDDDLTMESTKPSRFSFR